MTTIPKRKTRFLAAIALSWIALAVILWVLVGTGAIERAPPTPIGPAGTDEVNVIPPRPDVETHLQAAQGFVYEKLAREDGHVYLYHLVYPDSTFPDVTDTNSEATSYYLLWTAQHKDKAAFDNELSFIKREMMHPTAHYMRWRIEENGSIISDGGNIASDADLRAIKALMIAEDTWGDAVYTETIDELAQGLETVAITADGYLAPYGGGDERDPWIADETWLSYEDFVVTKELSERRGEPWVTLHRKMKNASLGAQIHNGLFNSQLTQSRGYGNGIDGGVYSINSMWIMIRMAESDDPELRAAAKRSLAFYKNKYQIDGQIFATYGSNGDALSPSDTPWGYALVGRAAAALDDREFADAMMFKLTSMQVMDATSPINGAFLEGAGKDLRAGQFTIQESILTMQEYLAMRERLDLD
jgi:endo-1,4-beta-D-glucanase Y